jgi:ribosomal-protein-serine acetyltransferase
MPLSVLAPKHALAMALGGGLALRLRERHHSAEFLSRLERERRHLAESFVWVGSLDAEAVAALVERGLAQFARGDGWQVDLCVAGRPVGALGLHHLDEPGGSTEVGFWLEEAAQGHGFMSTALQRLLPYFFLAKHLEHVRIGVVPGHGRGEAVARRLGFTREALLRRAHMLPAGPADLAFYGLRREAWSLSAQRAEPQPARFALQVDEELSLMVAEQEDAAALHALIESERSRLARFLPWAATQTLEGTERFLAEARGALARGDGWHFGVLWRGALHGMVGIHGVRETPRRGSLGYWLSSAAQGQGVATRAVAALIDKAFFDLGFERLDIRAELENARSRAVAQRLGFEFEGVLPLAARSASGYVDHAVYGLLRGEWRSSSQTEGSLRTVGG